MEEYGREKSWASRNWGWLVGGGCLTIIVIGVLAIGGIIYKVSDSISGSEPYTHAFTKASENEKVIEFLGTPIEINGMGSNNYSYKNGSTTVDLTIPIKGPNDEGNIYIEAEKINDEWAYNTLYVKIDGETEAINLLDVDIDIDLEESLD